MRLPFMPFIPFGWTTRVTVVDPPTEMTYEQKLGPYAHFQHIHRLTAQEQGTLVEDIVRYQLPGGLVGALLGHHIVKHWLQYIFHYRNSIVSAADTMKRIGDQRP
jgi:ligand-binding SRPBCC domain-containing protein